MQDLHSIGMKKGMLYETIITTINPDKTPNAAPMGVICKDKGEIVVYLHEGSRTIKNIKNNRAFVVNVLKDPLVFVDSTLDNLSEEYFLEFKDNYAVKNADAYFLAKVNDLKYIEREDQFGIDKSYIIKAGVEEIVVDNECAEPLNRAIYGVIEALVYLTRKDMVSGETEKLYNLRMKEISRIVNKVGSKKHTKAIKKVMDAWDEDK